MRDGVFNKEINLIFADIGGNMTISGAKFDSLLNLTGAHIKSEMSLASDTESKPVWGEHSRLVLRNTAVGCVQTPPDLDAFPKDLDLDGYSYTRLGGLGSVDSESEMASRPPEWFIEWLNRDRSYSPQPYQQLAEVLRAMGHSGKANNILYAGKERERSELIKRKKVLRWFGMSLLNWTIGYGYGYRYFYSLFWVIGFTIIGAWVFSTTVAGKCFSPGETFAFSFDLLLPLVKFDESHYKIPFSCFGDWQRYYFYAHKLVGYVLGSFVVAGLTGITKK